MKKAIRIILVLLSVFISLWVLKKLDVIPSLSNIFSAKAVEIDETPIILKEIRSIGELVTYSSFDELVVDSAILDKKAVLARTANPLLALPFYRAAPKRLVLICKGKVLAGPDLSLLGDSSIRLRNDTLFLLVPKSRVLDVIINPTDIETFVEKGQWSSHESNSLKLQAKQKITLHALQQGILQKADSKARKVLENYMENIDDRKVVVSTEED